MKVKRLTNLEMKDFRNQNIYCLYPIDKAAWLWHPDCANKTVGSMVMFQLDVDLNKKTTDVFYISADNRYEFFVDGKYVSMGPDRGDVNHWGFAALEITLEKGRHTLTARCHYFPVSSGFMPMAQMAERPGFTFAAGKESLMKQFNTGLAPWTVRKLNGFSFAPGGWATCSPTVTDFAEYFKEEPFVSPVVTMGGRRDSIWGGREEGKRLAPSNMPEQTRTKFTGKLDVRAIVPTPHNEHPFRIEEKDTKVTDCTKKWTAFLNKGTALTVPPHADFGVLVDFNTYVCVFPQITVDSGDLASVKITFMEALQSDINDICAKGNRNDVVNKYFVAWESQKDIYKNFDGHERTFSSIWWRAGRYALIHVKTDDTPLILKKLDFMESNYPFKNESKFVADDENLNVIQPMMLRVMQACMHETYVDCPYYEQLQYVGDGRIEAVTTYSILRDANLQKRSIHLFDWSRSDWDGIVAERHPSNSPQLSCTYSMIWPLMLRDYMMYRPFPEKAEFTHLRRGVRAMLMAMEEYVNGDGLIENLSGWSFVDWIKDKGDKSWNAGIPPHINGENGGNCSIFSMHYLFSLQAAIQLEKLLYPDELTDFANYYQHCFDRTATAVKKYFWDDKEKLFADDMRHEYYSMHAQCMALLADLLPEKTAKACVKAMLTKKDIHLPTLYFIYYLFDTLQKYGMGEKILDFVYIWTDMLKKGAVTAWECPEPTRSDCHAWSGHLYHHYFASIAGIRPASVGFKTVSVQPSMGHLKHISGSLVHPDGFIDFDLKKVRGSISGTVTLPNGVTGTWVANGKKVALHEGKNIIK